MPTITHRTRKRLSQKQLRNQCRASRRQQARKARASRRQIDRIHDQLPKQVRTVFDPVEPAFTHPTHHRFVLLALAAILTLRGRTIANLLRCLGSLAPGHSKQSSPHLLPATAGPSGRWHVVLPSRSSPVVARRSHRTGWRRHRQGAPRQERLWQGLPSRPGPFHSLLHRQPLGAQVGCLDRACPGPLCHCRWALPLLMRRTCPRKKTPARAAAQDALGIDPANVGCLDPLVPRPPVHLHGRRRLRHPRLGQLRTSALPSF